VAEDNHAGLITRKRYEEGLLQQIGYGRYGGFTRLTLGLADGHEQARGGVAMAEHPTACPVCGGAALIRLGHACGRQRWRCKGCGRQFTRATPRGKPAAMKGDAVALYCTGLSLNAIGKRLGVSAQSVMRWGRDHARRRCPKPEPTGRAAVVELDEMWHFVEKKRAGSGSGRRSSAAQAG
jgi:transposase-like protein